MKKIQITGSTLKIIAMISMLIDHIGAGLLDKILIANGYQAVSFFNMDVISTFSNFKILGIIALVCRIIGRLAFPIYCFLLVEGFKHTHNIKKYILRLFIFALISEIPFDLAFSSELISFSQQNIFFSLTLGMIILWIYKIIDQIKNKNTLLNILSIANIFALGGVILFLLLGAKWADKSIIEMGIIYILIVYLFAVILATILYLILIKKYSFKIARNKYSKLFLLILIMFITYIFKCDYSFGVLIVVTIIYKYNSSKIKGFLYSLIALTILDPCEMLGIVGLIPVACYNGNRGLKLKYFFYFFYPLHLLIISLIVFIINC